MCYRRVPYATYENSEEAVAERNDAYLATEAFLVDDTVILWLLSSPREEGGIVVRDRGEHLQTTCTW